MWKIFSSSKLTYAFSTLEVATATAFLAILLTGSYSVFQLSLTTVERARQYTTAELLAHDLIELTGSKRNENWNSLVAGEYHFVQDPIDGLLFANGSEEIDAFYTRSVVLSEVSRDNDGDIVSSGGTVDPDSILATATVTWSYRGQDYQTQLIQLFTNWRRF